MSDSSGRLGLRGLGLALSPDGGTVYPVLKAMWTEEKGGQQNVSRGMTSRGIWESVEELAPCLQEHIHTETPEGELARRGAEGTARRLVAIARDPDRDPQVRRRIKSLLERWAEESGRDRAVIEAEW